jgi:drug/metabolite transporter (DMT)-like permease
MKRDGTPVSQLQAVGLALAAFTCWVLADTSVKLTGASGRPVPEVVAIIGAAIVGLMLVYALWRRDLRGLWPRSPLRQLGRSTLDLANNFGVVIALRHLPLALFYILVFFTPMVTTVLAAIFLGESLEWRKAAAVLAGFAGVVVAVDPLGVKRPGDWIGYVACSVCVLCFSANIVWSRVMTQSESSESLTFFSGALMAVAGACAMLPQWAPVSGRMGLTLGACGLFCVVGSLCFFVALRHAPAATVSQYHYSQLVTGSLLAYAIWGERLTPAMVMGAALIVAAGWYTAARSRRERQAVEPAIGSML